jgi:hypothetical protein
MNSGAFEARLIELLTRLVRTITEKHHIRLDERAQGFAKAAL